jgi:HSP20 family protein
MEGRRSKEQGGMPVRRERGWMDPWSRFSEEVDRMFDELWHPSFFRRGRMTRMWTPQIDVLEKEGSLVVRADLPGISRDDLEVEVADNMLTLRGERRHEEEQQEEGYYRAERSYGSFSRTIPLPEGVSTEDVKATFNDGVLEIRIPVPQQQTAQARRIQIEEGGRRGQKAQRAGMAAQGGQESMETPPTRRGPSSEQMPSQGAGTSPTRAGTAAGQQAASRAGARGRSEREARENDED